MRGITIIFDNTWIHTGNDLDLVQEKKEIGKPNIQSYTVQVPGRNGLLNLTKGLTGNVVYNNRTLSFQYFGSGSRDHLLELEEEMLKYHGETIRIVDDDYPDYYYEGEVSVDTELHSNYITIKLEVDAQPFKLKLEKTVFTRSIKKDGFAKICLNNESIPAVPTITVSPWANVVITYKGNRYELNTTGDNGSFYDSRFELKRGLNEFDISVSGNNGAVISFEYQEGSI